MAATTLSHEDRTEVGGWVIHFLRKAGREDLLPLLRVEWSNRFTRRMGDALYMPAAKGPSLNILPKARARFSIPLWARASKEERRNTVAHEMAHLVVYHEWYLGLTERLFGELPGRSPRRPPSHGWEWKAVMARMGERAERTHNVDRTGLRRKVARVLAYCDCRSWELTPRKATKIPHLFCRACKATLRLTDRPSMAAMGAKS